MKRFRFSLERVERWRAMQATLQQAKVQRAGELLRAARDQSRAHEQMLLQCSRQLSAGCDATLLGSYTAYLARAAKEGRELATAVERLESAVATEMRRLDEIHRGHKLLEKLHESRLSEWKAESMREEEAFAGEAFLARVQSGRRARSSVG